MVKKLTTKEDLLKALTNDEIFTDYQLSFYYDFNKIVDAKLLDDFEVMKTIIEIIPHSYKYIKYTHLKDNRELLLLAIKRGNKVLEFASKSFRKDREIAEEIILHGNVNDAQHFSEEFLNDVDFMRKACLINPEIYKFLPDDVKENKLVINDFLKGANRQPGLWFYRYLPRHILNNRNFVLNYITDERSAAIYGSLSDELKKDPEIAFRAATYGANIKDINLEEVRDDYEIMANSIRQRHINYMYASERLKGDERIINILLGQNLCDWGVYRALPEKFKSRKDIILRFDPELIDLETLYKEIPSSLRNDPDIIARFGAMEATEITYFWYHGFYTKEEAAKIKNAIRTHDYDAFMKFYNKKRRGLPKFAIGYNDKGSQFDVDITIRENFVKITSEESEAG